MRQSAKENAKFSDAFLSGSGALKVPRLLSVPELAFGLYHINEN